MGWPRSTYLRLPLPETLADPDAQLRAYTNQTPLPRAAGVSERPCATASARGQTRKRPIGYGATKAGK
jgi:hypothetical protein